MLSSALPELPIITEFKLRKARLSEILYRESLVYEAKHSFYASDAVKIKRLPTKTQHIKARTINTESILNYTRFFDR